MPLINSNGFSLLPAQVIVNHTKLDCFTCKTCYEKIGVNPEQALVCPRLEADGESGGCCPKDPFWQNVFTDSGDFLLNVALQNDNRERQRCIGNMFDHFGLDHDAEPLVDSSSESESE